MEFYQIFNVKPPCTNVNPSHWKLSGDGSDLFTLDRISAIHKTVEYAIVKFQVLYIQP